MTTESEQNIKENAEKLVTFYQKLANNPRLRPKYKGNDALRSGPAINSDLSQWILTEPNKTPVDLSFLLNSGIDCEFCDSSVPESREVIGKLVRLNENAYLYGASNRNSYRYCYPRMHHIHSHLGSTCPLPKGIKVKVFYQNTGHSPYVSDASSIVWEKVTAFEVLGLSVGYCWEIHNDN